MIDECFINEMEDESVNREDDERSELEKISASISKKKKSFGCTYCGQKKPISEKSKSYKSVCNKCAKDIADWGCE